MKNKLSTKFFNFGLFLEGLKRLQVIGIATAILSLTVSALIPIVSWMESERYAHQITKVNVINSNQVCPSLFFLLFFAPFFILTIFSFLHKRKESDFFHAIPYTRTCVYVSFVTSALAMIFAIHIASAAISGILWAINPYSTYDLGSFIILTLISMLCSALLAGIMALAVSLTGTKLTTLLMFGIICIFTRLIALYMGEIIAQNIDVLNTVPLYFLRMDWFLPFGFWSSGLGTYRYTGFNPLQDPACIIYNIVMTLLVFAFGWFFYQRRKSEMAGNTAPSRLSQHIFRCLFTIPLALLIPTLALLEAIELPSLFVLIVVTLLVYYLYELITTKRAKNLVSATPWLLVIATSIALFTCTYYAIEGIVLNTPIKKENVVSVSMSAVNQLDYDTYQEQLMYDKGTTDAEIISQICESYATTQKCDKKDNFSAHQLDLWRDVTFTLKSGQKVTRSVCFNDQVAYELDKKYIESLGIDETIYDIPEEPLVIKSMRTRYCPKGSRGQPAYYFSLTHQYQEMYEIIYNEYTALSDEDKYAVRHHTRKECVELMVGFRKPSDRHQTVYVVLYIDGEKMPESFGLFKKYIVDFFDD